jgi:hypothetical protein
MSWAGECLSALRPGDREIYTDEGSQRSVLVECHDPGGKDEQFYMIGTRKKPFGPVKDVTYTKDPEMAEVVILGWLGT